MSDLWVPVSILSKADTLHAMPSDLAALGLRLGDFAVFGSGPLLARGWIDTAGDLDVLARGPAWRRAQELGELKHLEKYNVDIIEIGSHITVGTAWGIGEFDTDELIDTAELIHGVPCVLLRHVIAYKRIAGRAKDVAHLEIIEYRLGRGKR